MNCVLNGIAGTALIQKTAVPQIAKTENTGWVILSSKCHTHRPMFSTRPTLVRTGSVELDSAFIIDQM